jgi:hypothetical protein
MKINWLQNKKTSLVKVHLVKYININIIINSMLLKKYYISIIVDL